MTRKIGFIIDPPDSLKPVKDSSVAMMEAAQRRGWEIHVMEQHSLLVKTAAGGSLALAETRTIATERSGTGWYRELDRHETDLGEFDIIMMRKDPPFDMEYINTTYILDIACEAGSVVVNSPSALRNANEKMFITLFPQCCTPMCISSDPARLRRFVLEHEDVIVKPLDGMGGAGIFRLTPGDANLSVVLESITLHGNKTVMAQTFIPEISAGDKRILLIDGEPVPWALARIPAKGETRGNLAAGGRGVGIELSDRDRWICQQLAPVLRERGIVFAGIDVIGDYLTEINITSPTCIRELDSLYDLDIASDLLSAVESRLE